MTSFTDWRAELAALSLFDANVRVGPSGPLGALALDAEPLQRELERFSITRALAAHWAGIEYDAASGNRRLAKLQSDWLVPVYAATPEILSEIERLRPRAVQLSFGALRHNFASAAWGCGELCEYLQSRRVVTVIGREDLDWEGLARLLADFPDLPVVFLNAGYRGDRYLWPLLRRHAHLHFDTSGYLAHRQLEAFVERMGAERALFGSRLPLFTPGAAVGALLSARIGDEQRRAVAGGNLRRLLAEVKP